MRLLVGLLAVAALVPARAEARVSVVATTEHCAAIARAVGGDRVAVAYLAKGSQDPHAVVPKRSFSVLLNRADVLIANGQGLESAWLPTVLSESTNGRILEGKPGYLDASVGATLLPYDPAELKTSPLVRALVAAQSVVLPRPSEVASGNNHHYWLDPGNGSAIAKVILDKLVLLDPSSASAFQANYARFVGRLKGKLAEWDAKMKPFEGVQIVSYHRNWTYLARRHGFKIAGYIEPSEPLILGSTNLDNPPDRGEKAELIARMRGAGARLIVAEAYHDQALTEEIARGADAAVLILPASVSQADGLDDYFMLFEEIYRRLARALAEVRTRP
jgi:zinc/manganese transport system substrate-binding protein